jgi:hypothetical protein
LENHRSEVQVVKYLLHVLSQPSPTPPHLAIGLWKHHEHASLQTTERTWGWGGLARYRRWSRWVPMLYFLHGNSTATKVTGFCAFHQRSSWMGRRDEKKTQKWQKVKENEHLNLKKEGWGHKSNFWILHLEQLD